MSRLFGPIRQMGFVVRDLERAVQYWTQTLLGIGMRFAYWATDTVPGG